MTVLYSLLVISAGCFYASLVRKKIGHSPTAKARLLWALPALALFCTGPFLISVEEGAILQGLEAWCIGWVGGGKLVSIALKTSPIDVNSTTLQFLLQLALPILPVDRINQPNAPAQTITSIATKLIIALTASLLLFVPLTTDIAAETWKPHVVVEAITTCGVLWSFLELVFHSLNLLAAGLGIPTKPCMRNPLLSSSLRDFWAHRWNLPTTENLRVTCYDPLVSFLAPSTIPKPSANGSTPVDTSPASAATSTANHLSSDTLSQRRAQPASSTEKALPANGRRSRSPRQKWAAFAGLCFAFFLSGAVHHWLLGLFTKMDLLADYRFGILFWIQPPMMMAQEAWIRSGWWRGMKANAPAAAWLTQWVSTLVLFLVPFWFLMRDPFLDNPGGRGFVLLAMRDLRRVCRAVLPDAACSAATRLEPLLDAVFGM
eukprot:jgi/Ulvmu1/2568/UM014_0019.1